MRALAGTHGHMVCHTGHTTHLHPLCMIDEKRDEQRTNFGRALAVARAEQLFLFQSPNGRMYRVGGGGKPARSHLSHPHAPQFSCLPIPAPLVRSRPLHRITPTGAFPIFASAHYGQLPPHEQPCSVICMQPVSTWTSASCAVAM
jgi:hypothetical protein